METYVRGFSFMPETKVDTGELKVRLNYYSLLVIEN